MADMLIALAIIVVFLLAVLALRRAGQRQRHR
ncbi:hypothetical protein FB470_006987 [Amycolatopsis thermophila]|uniref:Uncharacterized protein n=1 Tax=Amycolatopsis thermophila TaxID=206084 RepID=A0ABU0F646_9PSEU|nr:hypothetical protein [Amycolatopsis thermophila]